jgi:hypothetical protein
MVRLAAAFWRRGPRRQKAAAKQTPRLNIFHFFLAPFAGTPDNPG